MPKTKRLKITKGQFNQLLQQHVGTGFIALKSGKNEALTIEVYIGRDGVLRRIANGKPLLPITVLDDEEGEIVCISA